MTVRVELTQKQRLDNHRPEFRPTDSAKLYGSERTLASAVNRIADAIPESLVVDYIYGRVQATSLTRRITDLVEDDPTMIERPLFSAFQVGQADDAAQQRKDVNRRLRELGATVRLRSKDELRKALDEIVWGPVLDDFNVTDPNAPARIHAPVATHPDRPVPVHRRLDRRHHPELVPGHADVQHRPHRRRSHPDPDRPDDPHRAQRDRSDPDRCRPRRPHCRPHSRSVPSLGARR